mmetsp:Transcript_15972/g.34676  ORF Transcript_15972/g.34676 Transcript_15972/m.34676 type:complete len:181 (-) Transcript_15972:377-919(-)
MASAGCSFDAASSGHGSVNGEGEGHQLKDDARSYRQKQEELKHARLSRTLLSLNTVLMSIGKQELTVECRDERVLCGMLEEADENMNLSLSNVTVTPAFSSGDPAYHTAMYVAGTSIRCVHLPNHISAPRVMTNRLRAADSARTEGTLRKKKEEKMPDPHLAPLVGATVTEADADLYVDL